jgi:hypothetical protein
MKHATPARQEQSKRWFAAVRQAWRPRLMRCSSRSERMAYYDYDLLTIGAG